MLAPNLRYNERSWAIDVITEINIYCNQRTRAIVRAGGEHSLVGYTGNLFPDVLLFGDNNGTIVQQGWELKMPDTPITDTELLSNAENKARRLGLNSFLVWNANEAVLYIKNNDENFQPNRTWPPTNISRRRDVVSNRDVWVELLHHIIDDLNNLFDDRIVSGATPDNIISDALFIDYITHFSPQLTRKIQETCRQDAIFAANLNIWWEDNEIEHPGINKFEAHARVNILNWINKFLFAHYLKRYHNAARTVESIQSNTSIIEAIDIFQNISSSNDFFQVFSESFGQRQLDPGTWSGLVGLNTFLTQIQLESLSQQSLQNVLENALLYSRKKLAGQYSTPKPLAELLVRLTIINRSLPSIDPCCGTGTIARAVYELKRMNDITISEAFQQVWACDKFAFPLQLCSIALLDPEGLGEVMHVFQQDVFDLNYNQVIPFIDPNNGNRINQTIPYFHAIVSNLPFVRFENSHEVNPLISRVRESVEQYIGSDDGFDSRTDLYAYIILHLFNLLNSNGRVGVITSNSWLATEWGNKFKEILLKHFYFEKVLISNKGRWFKNADVVTTMLILRKRQPVAQPLHDEQIEFITTTEDINDWESMLGGVSRLADDILVMRETGDQKYTCKRYRINQIQVYESLGINWSAYFVDLDWLMLVAPNLVPVSTFFNIQRGERRGWDPLFYPNGNHGIEPEYIKRVLISIYGVDRLFVNAENEAFCCSESIEELRRTHKNGALNWIQRFENATNKKGQQLTDTLQRSGCYWYEMRPNTLADLVISMNPDQKLCVHRLSQRSFVNQRLIRFTEKDTIPNNDIGLYHALMNSIFGMFQIEASGFGRGLGVLDLNAKKLSKGMHMLNPSAISDRQKEDILNAFSPLLSRSVLNLYEELQSEDRINFDTVVLNSYGIANLRNQIYDSLKLLFHIRKTVLE